MKLYIANYAFQSDVEAMKEDGDFTVFDISNPSFTSIVAEHEFDIERVKEDVVKSYSETMEDYDNHKYVMDDFFFYEDPEEVSDLQLFTQLCVYEKEGFETCKELFDHHKAEGDEWSFYPIAVITVVVKEV